MDISQSVFASFFVRTALGQYDLESPEKLLRLLVNMSRNKVAHHVRQEGAARRDYRRVAATSAEGAAATGPDPGQQAATKELLQEFRKRLSPDERQLAEARAAGQTWWQIAAEQGASAQALRKRLSRAVERIAEDLNLDGASDG
jgi:RNA polymerase sigma-70 factor (ECF subfamily)